MERTFVALKPDAVKRCLVGEIISRFERKGYKIQEIIEVREGFFRIIYTSEDEMICSGMNRYFDVEGVQ